ncbi:MAG: hypothetical protein GC161_11100 [Planctomycetaceae bacterium]|nr:hypothetical protein [Planctomycetaceae bacterium]
MVESTEPPLDRGRRRHPAAAPLAILAAALLGLWLWYGATPASRPAGSVRGASFDAVAHGSERTPSAQLRTAPAASLARSPVDADVDDAEAALPAELAVEIRDLDPSLDVRLEVHDSVRQRLVHTSLHSGEVAYAGLIVPVAYDGEVQVVARVGQRVGVSDPLVLVPGARSDVALVLRGAPSGGEAFTVLGLLEFAKEDCEWLVDQSLELSFRVEDPSSPWHFQDLQFLSDADLVREPEPSDRRSFRTAPLPPGKYGVHLRGFGRVHGFELVEDGQFLVVAVPRMGHALVRLVDGFGRPLEGARASWSRLEGRHAMAWVQPTWHAGRAELTARLLPGRWSFDTGLEEYYPRQFSAEVPSGEVAFAWTLERAHRMELRAVVQGGGLGMPVSWWHGAEVESTGGGGRLLATRVRRARGGVASRAEFTVSAPGMYRVAFGELPGYDLPLEVFVDAREGSTAVVEFDVRTPSAAARGSKSGEER